MTRSNYEDECRQIWILAYAGSIAVGDNEEQSLVKAQKALSAYRRAWSATITDNFGDTSA